MLTIENLKKIEFDSYTCTSDGLPVNGTRRPTVVMFNQTQISADEVNKLIKSGMYEYDNRVVVMTPKQAEFLHDKEDIANAAT